MTPMDLYYASIRYLYRGGRQSRLARFVNSLWAKLFAAGIMPNRLATLEVRGRKSGRTIAFPIVIADHADQRYLVSMLGERANWVQNVRAAGGLASLRHGRRESVRLQEVDARERAPIVRRYLEVAPGARPHIHVDYRAPLEEFERIAPELPVFRVVAAA